MKRLFAIAPLMFLVACDVTVPVTDARPTLPADANDTCNANQYRGLIGQDVTALERVLILREVRVIRPGHAVTTDFRQERLNFDVGPDNRIASIRCN